MKVTLNNIGKKYESREDFTLRNINLEIGENALLCNLRTIRMW